MPLPRARLHRVGVWVRLRVCECVRVRARQAPHSLRRAGAFTYPWCGPTIVGTVPTITLVVVSDVAEESSVATPSGAATATSMCVADGIVRRRPLQTPISRAAFGF